eukprot:TRINITY_DN59361_c0_g1_i2.p1 TRINITY_DN59361_c0_g1~~TRINITY_DN59361_c0_g1_i2.p1  ORF type:complete len:364 (-),score=26.97 TRINITY_DN59361_c0_g1_i2:608-1699(-)
MSYQVMVSRWQTYWPPDAGVRHTDAAGLSVLAQRSLRGYIHSTHNRGPFHWVPFLEMFDWLMLQWNPGSYTKIEVLLRQTAFWKYSSDLNLPVVGAFLVRQRRRPKSIFLSIPLLPYFLRFVLKKLPTAGVVIYMGRSWEDAVVPDSWLHTLVAQPKLKHLFIENPQQRLPKVTAMPIGMDPVFLQNESGRALQEIANTVSLQEKIVLRVASGFGVKGPVRAAAKKYMQDHPSWCDWIDTKDAGGYGVRQLEYWRQIVKYAFVLSPPAVYLGQGPRGPPVDTDSYRTTEILALRSIPILWDGPNAWAWEGLPVVVVSDWSEIHPANLERWWQERKHLLAADQPYLRSTYWWRKVEQAINLTLS